MSSMTRFGNFDTLTPEVIFAAAENALERRFSGVLMPLPSYINRVYELEALDRERFILKFYRPGRWSRPALLEEHLFTLQARDAEIPVIAPLALAGGSTLGRAEDGTYFAAFPKRWGRALEPQAEPALYTRLGALLARLHQVGAARTARNRLTMNPAETTLNEVAYLLTCGAIPPKALPRVGDILKKLLAALVREWHPGEIIRLHGDCHKNNILERPDEGLMLIDFDDMMNGPPLQDLWLLLPGSPQECRMEFEALLRGYESMRPLDRAAIRGVESLRAMRMIYFLEWCARQREDYNFRERYPDWGGDAFWSATAAMLEEQLRRIDAE